MNPTSGSTDIGVLVVHGIGNQKPNATLGEFDDALVGSLRRWLGPAAVAGELRPADGDTPAHAHVTIDDPDGGEPMRALVAEGHWADTVDAPEPGTLLKWLLAVVPFVVPRVLDGGLRRNSMRIDRLRRSRAPHRLAGLAGLSLWRLVQNVVVVGVTIALLAVLVATWLLAAPRALYERLSTCERLRPLATRGLAIVGGLVIGAVVVEVGRELVLATEVQLALVLLCAFAGTLAFTLPHLVNTVLGNFVGDCYALLCDPRTERKMVERVEARLAWLEARVGDAPIVVVAHSQGTEIVRRVLAERDRPVRGLVTLGSAIAKLSAVSHLRDSPWSYSGAFALRIASAGLLVHAALIVDGPWRDPQHLPAAALVVAAAAAAFTANRIAMQHILDRAHADNRPRMEQRHVARWVDFYTSADPVPEGALPIAKSWGYSREIVNCRVPLLDHVKYWGNVQGFCATVAIELAEMAGRPRGNAMSDAVAAGAAERAHALALRIRVRAALAVAAIAGVVINAVINDVGFASLGVAAATVGAAVAIECVLAKRAGAIARDWAPCAQLRARLAASRQG